MASSNAPSPPPAFPPPLQPLLEWLSRGAEGEQAATAREVAEMVWLASRLPPLGVEAAAPSTRPEAVGRQDPGALGPLPPPEPDPSPAPLPPEPPPSRGAPVPFFPPAPRRERPAPREAQLMPLSRVLPRERDLREHLASLPLRVSLPRLLPPDRDWQRPLRPLLATSPRPGSLRLDEEATVQRSAEVRRLLPVLSPLQQPRFSITLLVDQGQAMELWQPLVEELRQVLIRSHGFREVRRLNLHPPRSSATGPGLERVGCRRGQHPIVWLPPRAEPPVDAEEQKRWRRSLASRLEPSDSLLLVISDTAGPHWWDGSLLEAIRAWSGQVPLAILHTLPPWLARRTALRVLARATMANAEPGGLPGRYRVQDTDALEAAPRRGGGVPLLTLDPKGMARWAALVMGQAGAVSAGVVLPAETEPLRKRLEARRSDGEAECAGGGPTALERWERFRGAASSEASQLLSWLAAAPVLTLPVMRLIKEATLGPRGVGPLALVEVLLSGVLRPRGAVRGVEDREVLLYEIVPDLAEALRADLSDHDTVTVVRLVSELLERRWDSLATGHSFLAALTDPGVRQTLRRQDPELAADLLSFATATADRIAKLPGAVYQDFAARLRSQAAIQPQGFEALAFQDKEFNTALLLPIPTPQTITFSTAGLEELLLEWITFPTARVIRQQAGFTVRHGEGEGWAFSETLQPQISLTLVEIPAGRFTMGSPDGELERHADEGPQHEVGLASFFMGQTPITQEQWRVVAQWQEREGERWGRELSPNPSRFGKRPGSDQRPVEEVSWLDAMEFCHRLSQRTGLMYTLPSEAQWEYACRAGTISPFAFGDTITPELANYDATSSYFKGPKGRPRSETTVIKTFPANDWGLYDMHGNVWEWCLDRWHSDYEGAPPDGSAWDDPEAGDGQRNKDGDEGRRLLRGGSWSDDPRDCRSAYRTHVRPLDAYYGLVGFRVVCLPQGRST